MAVLNCFRFIKEIEYAPKKSARTGTFLFITTSVFKITLNALAFIRKKRFYIKFTHIEAKSFVINIGFI